MIHKKMQIVTSLQMKCALIDTVLYYCKCCYLIGYTLLAIYSSIDIEWWQGQVSRKKTNNAYLIFWNDFKEITNTSLFLLKQLDYLLAIYRKR